MYRIGSEPCAGTGVRWTVTDLDTVLADSVVGVLRDNSGSAIVREILGPLEDALYRESNGTAASHYSIGHAREFLKGMDAATWGRVRPASSALSGDGYRRVWRILSGEGL